jgi:hypothetical protein
MILIISPMFATSRSLKIFFEMTFLHFYNFLEIFDLGSINFGNFLDCIYILPIVCIFVKKIILLSRSASHMALLLSLLSISSLCNDFFFFPSSFFKDCYSSLEKIIRKQGTYSPLASPRCIVCRHIFLSLSQDSTECPALWKLQGLYPLPCTRISILLIATRLVLDATSFLHCLVCQNMSS